MATFPRINNLSLSPRQVHNFTACIAIATVSFTGNPAIAQSVTQANDGTGTNIIQSDNEYLINGGTTSGDNLFHSFDTFGLDSGEIANFVGTPNLNNILGRVTGGEVSIVDGLLQVSGSDANLYLLNPSGFIFGNEAQLDVTGSFTAATATRLSLGDDFFNSFGENNYAALTGNPTGFVFDEATGAIFNQGTLSVPEDQSLWLVGSSVLNLGTITGGDISIVAMPEQRQIKINSTGSLLSLVLEAAPLGGIALPENLNLLTPADLPKYLTGTETAEEQALIDSTVSGDVSIAGLVQGENVQLLAASKISGDRLVIQAGESGLGGLTVGRFRENLEDSLGYTFIDQRVDNPEQLLFGGEAGTIATIVLKQEAGLEVVTNALLEFAETGQTLDAVNIVAEGNEGYFWLGNELVNGEAISAYQSQLHQWRSALGADADLLLYSCFTALGMDGEVLMQQLADLTGADVAASLDVTGNENFDGNWQLESSTGAIEAANPFTLQTIATWEGKLATITVTSLADTGANTLRQAFIDAANGDLITFAPGLFGQTINLASQINWTTDNLTVDGDLNNDTNPDITVNANSDIFNISANNGRLIGLTLRQSGGGYTNAIVHSGSGLVVESSRFTHGGSGYGSSFFNDDGSTATIVGSQFTGIYGAAGAIDNDGDLTIRNSTISGSTGQAGGGIQNEGTLRIYDSQITNNTGNFGGGGIYNSRKFISPGNYEPGILTVTNSTISGNTALDRRGGGILNRGIITNILNSTIENNVAGNGTNSGIGGGIFNEEGYAAPTSGVATITDSTIRNNSADLAGGGIFNSTNATLTLTNTRITGNTADNDGGGIFNTSQLTINNGSQIDGNTVLAGSGGGISNNYSSASLTLEDSIITGNNASANGGGINNDAGNLFIRRSSIFSNQAGTNGAGIANSGNTEITNSTLSGNNASGNGGGIWNDVGSSLTVINNTVVGNSAIAGGGIYNRAALTLTNSIIANSTTGGDYGFGGGASRNLQGANLVRDGSITGANVINADPILSNLANYGGTTPTHFIAYNSPARNAGNNALAVGGIDQRGGDRRVGTVDLGAVELQPINISLVAGNNQSTTVNTNFSNPLRVRATESTFGNLVGGVPIAFQSPATGAGTNPRTFTTLTAPDGETAAIARANTAAGNFNLAANFGSKNVNFNLTNNPATPTQLLQISGNQQVTTISTPFLQALTVQVTDDFGNPVPGVTISFQTQMGVTGADGVLDRPSSQTNSEGLAIVFVSANNSEGQFQVIAGNSNLGTTTFNLDNVLQNFDRGSCPPECASESSVSESEEEQSEQQTEGDLALTFDGNSQDIPIGNEETFVDTEINQTADYSGHLDVPAPPAFSPDQAQNLLKNLDEQTDTKTAYITLRFRPQSIGNVAPENDEDVATALGQRELSSLKTSSKSQTPQKAQDTEPSDNWYGQLTGEIPKSPNDSLEVIITMGNGEITVKTLDLTRRQFQLLRNEVLRSVTRPSEILRQRIDRSLLDLYNNTFGEFDGLLREYGVDNLLVSLGDDLRSLPWDALYDGEQYLIEKYSFGITPSLSLTDTTYRPLQDRYVLVMGASDFNELEELPAVPIELRAIAEQVGSEQYFLNENFTRENLIAGRAAKAPGIIHLATHASFQSGDLENSYIQLWGNEQLAISEMEQLQWFNNPPVELLVLSACRTAIGDPKAELGFGGLAVKSGVRSAIASLWSVSDTGTLALMTEFYNNLRDPNIRTKSEALRQAKIALIRGNVTIEGNQLRGGLRSPYSIELLEDANVTFDAESLAHPFFWSPFTLIGSPW